MSNEYVPIACSEHDQYEAAITLKQKMDITWIDDGESHHDVLRPRDLKSSKKGEFLIAETEHGDALKIRLDWISKALVVTD